MNINYGYTICFRCSILFLQSYNILYYAVVFMYYPNNKNKYLLFIPIVNISIILYNIDIIGAQCYFPGTIL
jgi:hypothetical protein